MWSHVPWQSLLDWIGFVRSWDGNNQTIHFRTVCSAIFSLDFQHGMGDRTTQFDHSFGYATSPSVLWPSHEQGAGAEARH